VSRRLAALTAVVLACLAMPAAALADGDPASDVLLYQQTYLPYQPPSTAAKNELNAVVAAANKAGYPIRVAVIQSPTDLGSVPQLFGKPQTYVSFLSQELAFGYRKRVLIAMPAGFGLSPGLQKATGAQAQSGTGYLPIPDDKELKLVAKLPKPGSSPDQMTLAAAQAVRKLAAADGHTIPANPPVPGGGQAAAATPAAVGASSGSSLSTGRIVVAVAAVLVILVVGLGSVAFVLRRTQRPEPPDGDLS
jgi:hypothetical protein